MPEAARFKEVAVAICKKFSFFTPSFIGDGAYKEAYLTKTTDGFPVALKVFDPNKCNLDRASREIAAMQQCESSFIAKLFDWGIFESGDGASFLYVVEEYLSGGTLTERLASSSLSVIQVCDYGIALLDAVSHLKDNSLVHRDIKPDNILFRLNGNLPVLVDFGLVRDLSGASLTQTYLQQGPGTPFYASPEQLNNDKDLIDWRSDQFSIGIVLGICLTGSHPFQKPGQPKVNTVGQVINRAACTEEFSQKVGDLGFGFLSKMVSPWPVDRFSSPGVIQCELQNIKKELGG